LQEAFVGTKEWGWGSSMVAFDVWRWQFFRLQGKGYMCVVRRKRMTPQWGWIIAIERGFQIGVQECENGFKNGVREFKNGVS